MRRFSRGLSVAPLGVVGRCRGGSVVPGVSSCCGATKEQRRAQSAAFGAAVEVCVGVQGGRLVVAVTAAPGLPTRAALPMDPAAHLVAWLLSPPYRRRLAADLGRRRRGRRGMPPMRRPPASPPACPLIVSWWPASSGAERRLRGGLATAADCVPFDRQQL